ncbi:MAG: hypothetical protein DMG05_11695 [Acidobacteria bacterium]|nr:MAG: hypothetical protein DMG05_11695 [Acidobacteriota bacterium]
MRATPTTGAHLSGCLERTIHTEQGNCIQITTAGCGDAGVGPALRLTLDLEPQRLGEDEVTAGLRFLDRALARYFRALDVVLADGLYD